MRKKYVKPAAEVIELELVSMLAISSGGTLQVKGDVEADEELSNRRRNFWDEVGGSR